MSRTGRRKLFSWMIILALTATVPIGSSAEEESDAARECLLKAAFLYNFAKFVDWPVDAFENPEASFRLCILGDDTLGAATGTIENKEVKGRKLRVEKCQHIEEADGCHLLFISSSEKEALSGILDHVRGRSILTVSDFKGFAEMGGIIGLATIQDRIRFTVNLGAAKRTRLVLSSQLLKLGEVIPGCEEQERK